MIASTLQDRIKLALELSGRSKTDLWKGCGVSSGTVTAWFKGPNQTISGINLMNACKILGVNPEWLATGMGEMQTDNHHLYKESIYNERIVKFESIESSYSYKESSIEIYNIHTQEPIKSINFDLDWIKSRLPNHSLENLNIVFITNDSMLPTLKKGDFLIVDSDINIFTNDGVYIIKSSAGIFIKRIHKNMDGSLLIKSDNSAYGPETIFEHQLSDFKIIGKANLCWPEKSFN
jgi:phage repressor protein C with HTH and peptisase S24 domain